MTARSRSGGRRSEWLYALAFFGAHVGFMPLFVLLLPRRAEAIAGPGSVALLSLLLIAGGVTASLAHIAAGVASDLWLRRFGRRRGLIAIGAAALLAAYAALAVAGSAPALLAALVAFQLALNAMFAPLGALLADHVVDDRKGRVAALMNAALPLSGGATALAALLFPQDGPVGFLAVGLCSTLLVLPLLLAWPFAAPALGRGKATAQSVAIATGDYGLVWGARFLMQGGAAFLLNYFYLFLAERMGRADALASHAIGAMAGIAMVVAVGAALTAGHWSDRDGQRKPALVAGALLGAAAFASLAFGTDWPYWLAGYVLFNAGLAIFLSVDSALVAQLLGAHPRRGEFLGYMNLTNTLPPILVSAVALGVSQGVTRFDWPSLFAGAGVMALASAGLILRVRSIR